MCYTNNPLTLRTLYYSCVIPKAMYGSEHWSGVSNSDMSKLKSSHRLCVKFAQSYRHNKDTDFRLCTFGSVPLLNIVEYRKLVFFGQLCRLLSKYLANTAFNLRLIRFLNEVVSVRLCYRYCLDLVSRVCTDKDVCHIWKFSRSTPTAAKTCKISMCMFSE